MSLYLGEKLISGIGQDRIADTLPIGAIIEWDSDLIPENWLLLNGQAVSRTVYSELFDLYGTTYGTGDGSTTFNLPDRRTRVSVGKDINDDDFMALGVTGGEKEHTLTVDEMPRHDHDLLQEGNTSTFYMSSYYTPDSSGNYSAILDGTTAYASDISWGGKIHTQVAGNSQPHNNLQPYIVTNFIVKAKLYSADFIGTNTVIDSLDSDDSTAVLSAKMGKELNTKIENKITYGTEDLVDGESTLASGTIYFVYE